MTCNLLLWKWSDDFDNPVKRKKVKLKFNDITGEFTKSGGHPAIGVADIRAFCSAIGSEFGQNEDNRPFVFEDYGHCAVINYPNSVRFEIVPKVAAIGKRFGLNASEF